jgi:hypothetical protein
VVPQAAAQPAGVLNRRNNRRGRIGGRANLAGNLSDLARETIDSRFTGISGLFNANDHVIRVGGVGSKKTIPWCGFV